MTKTASRKAAEKAYDRKLMDARAQSPSPSVDETTAPIGRMFSGGGVPEWQQIVALCARHEVHRIPWQLRDELVTMLTWARYGEKVAASLASPPKTEAREPRAWEGYWPGAGSVNGQTSITRHRTKMERWAKDGAEITSLYANHEARGDGVRATDNMVERARRAILKCRFYDPEPHMYDGETAFFAHIETTDHWPEAEDEARDALEAALAYHAPALGETQPGLGSTAETQGHLGDGRAEIVEAGDHVQVRLNWRAAARPPVHPEPMDGRQTFATIEDCARFMARQPKDAELLSATKITSRSVDVTDAIRALSNPGDRQ